MYDSALMGPRTIRFVNKDRTYLLFVSSSELLIAYSTSYDSVD